MLDIVIVNVTLYTGPSCSLCDLAIELIEEFNLNVIASSKLDNTIKLTKVNIRNSTELYHLYATRIPVLKKADSNAELGWPFTQEDLVEFLK